MNPTNPSRHVENLESRTPHAADTSAVVEPADAGFVDYLPDPADVAIVRGAVTVPAPAAADAVFGADGLHRWRPPEDAPLSVVA